MATAFTQVPPDSTGDKLFMRTQTVGADVLHEQGVFSPGLPTYRAITANIVPANSKYHILVRNDTGSGQSLRILNVQCIRIGVAAVTGVINQFDLRRVTYTTPTGGAAITPLAFNTADPAAANVDAYGGATGGVTDVALLKSIIVTSEEGTAVTTNLFPLIDELNLMPTPVGGRGWVLRPGEGFGAKQNGAGTVGALQWIVDFALELD